MSKQTSKYYGSVVAIPIFILVMTINVALIDTKLSFTYNELGVLLNAIVLSTVIGFVCYITTKFYKSQQGIINSIFIISCFLFQSLFLPLVDGILLGNDC